MLVEFPCMPLKNTLSMYSVQQDTSKPAGIHWFHQKFKFD